MIRTLVVWCPDWPVTATGEPLEAPVVVLDQGVVLACSPAARARGVQRGLRRREAQARCPEALVVAHDPTLDARAFEPVVAVLETFVPAVEIVRPGVCSFPVRGPARYFGGEEALAERVTAAVESAVATARCRVGIAEGPFAATLAARRAVIVPRGEAPAFLAPLPVSVLERPELADLLRRLGARTLGQLAALPPAAVLARFGPDGALAHRLARGLDERPPALRVPPPDLTVTAELDPPVERVDAAAFLAKTLADELALRLSGQGLSCDHLRIEAETEHAEQLVRLWRHEGALSAGAIGERVRWQLDGWLSQRSSPGGLVLLRLVPEEVRSDSGRQLGFWGGTTVLDDRAARALARVQGLLGPEGVATAVLDGGRGPAERVRLVPWGDPRQPGRDPTSPWPGRVPAPAPATVHPVPRTAEVVDADDRPVRVNGRGIATAAPCRLSIGGGPWAQVAAWAGPWPVDERWWDTSAHQRRARWQVATSGGDAHLLSMERGRWSVEATYD